MYPWESRANPLRGFIIIALILLFITYLFGAFDDGSTLVKPCQSVGYDDDMWKACVETYMDQGWTYEEILEGVVVESK